MDGSTRAQLRYTIDTGTKPVNETVGPGGRLRRRSGGHDDLRSVEIRSARGVADLSLDRHGFVLVDEPIEEPDFWDERWLREVYYPRTADLIGRVSGGARVEIFDHTLRSQDPTRQERDFAREPVEIVHNDYTERSGPWRVRDIVPDEADALLEGRVAIVQVWRPLRVVEAYPLALCDAQTIDPRSFIAAERRHPNRVGEIYQLAHAPDHEWFYFPRMRPDEALVFKVYDSSEDGRARFTPHTSFAHPETGPDAIRESIEIRALVFF